MKTNATNGGDFRVSANQSASIRSCRIIRFSPGMSLWRGILSQVRAKSEVPRVILFLYVASVFSSGLAGAIEYPDSTQPGRADGRIQGNRATVQNDVIALTFKTDSGKLRPLRLIDKASNNKIDCAGCEFFRIVLDNARPLCCSELKIKKPPRLEDDPADPCSFNLAGRFAGKKISSTLFHEEANLQIDWSLLLRDGSNYIHQLVTLSALGGKMVVKTIVLIDLPHAEARVAGTVSGSPVVAGTMFFSYEHPNSTSQVFEETRSEEPARRFVCRLDRNAPLIPTRPLTQSSVMGVVPRGQLRRGFLYYLERQRARPYHPFLHYNSWYDIAWSGRKMNEAECLDVISHFGTELVKKRGVKMDSFVFDDGWDDNTTLWQMLSSNFPRGFRPLTNLARKYDSAIGVWLSPWGGYGQAKRQRLEYGKQQGFETNRRGFSLAGPKYYARFRQCCLDMMGTYAVNFFKFDGTDAQLLRETEALFGLIDEMRLKSPELFVSITSGTWASPFWLWRGDNIWRNGADMGFFGKGTRREQWITYRDMNTYRNVVKAGPLYPLNSLMLCGINNGQRGTGSDLAPFGKDFIHEVRSFFGTGTNLQELYMTPGRMTSNGWDVLAEGAKWSRANADVLVDTHWVGGDPSQFEVYGWAAWSPRKGILTLRNPNDCHAKIDLDIAEAFELPGDAPQRYSLRSPWKEDRDQPHVTLIAGATHTFDLQPFEVLVLEAAPIR